MNQNQEKKLKRFYHNEAAEQKLAKYRVSPKEFFTIKN